MLLAFSGFCSTVALVAAGAALLVMLFYVMGSVLGRYTGWWVFLGADEVGGYAMAALFFLGLAHTFRSGAFIRVTIVQQKLSPALRSASENLLYLVALAYAVILDWYFWQMILQSRDFGSTSIGVLAWPIWLPQLSLGIGAGIFALQIFSLLLGRLVGVVHGWLGEQEQGIQ